MEEYYYSHGNENTTVTADYESIITSSQVFQPEENKNAIEVAFENNNVNMNVKKAYYTALYRERYINYKSLNFGTE